MGSKTSSKNKNNFIKNLFPKSNISLLSTVIVVLVAYLLLFHQVSGRSERSTFTTIENEMVKNKYNSLVSILGKPTYIEKNNQDKLRSATWMSPLDNFNDFGKYGGCDFVKIYGNPAKKYHPHPAIVFLIIGKYVHVPEHLFGPLKYAS